VFSIWVTRRHIFVINKNSQRRLVRQPWTNFLPEVSCPGVQHVAVVSISGSEATELCYFAVKCKTSFKRRTDGQRHTSLSVRPSVRLLDTVWHEWTNGRTNGRTDAGNRIRCILAFKMWHLVAAILTIFLISTDHISCIYWLIPDF